VTLGGFFIKGDSRIGISLNLWGDVAAAGYRHAFAADLKSLVLELFEKLAHVTDFLRESWQTPAARW
jgi:hypothetical protein